MSRTKRRKHYIAENNTSWDRQGRLIAGPFTERHYERVDVGVYVRVYREPTPLELWKAKRRAFGESSNANACGPGKSYRNPRQRQNRMLTKLELFRYCKYEEYEVLVEANPRSAMWDWS
jgi:hypothetical protein